MAFIPNDPELPDIGDATFDPDQPIDNPYSPFIVGSLLSYVTTEAGSDELEERGDVFVTEATRLIEGVKATVVRDTVYDSEGRWVEDTLDWYAQDSEGNVWYLGENSFSFEYDEETGEFLGASPDGSWEWGVDGALPGLIRPAQSAVGDSYYQEFYPGEAEDAAQVLALDKDISLDFGGFFNVIKTFDFSTVELDAREYKFAAPGVGVILEKGLDEDDEVEEVTALVGRRSVGPAKDEADDVLLCDLREGAPVIPDEPDRKDFQLAGEGERERVHVTFLGGVDDLANAVGVYRYDLETGEIGEGRLLFTSTDRTQIGAQRSVEVEAGEGLGLFLVSGAENSGIDLAQFEDGGLRFRNLAEDAKATLGDGLAPVATDAEGNLLPFTIFHAFDDAEDGFNLLNAGGAAQATELEIRPDYDKDDEDEDADDDDDDNAILVGFEERMSTDPEFDGDFNDAVLSVSDTRLSDAAVAEIAAMFGTEIVARGGNGSDALTGGRFDDLLLGFGGGDLLIGRAGDDAMRGGNGDDVFRGGRGDDWMIGGVGDDVARFHGDAAGFAIDTDKHGRTIVEDIDASDGDFGVDTLRGVEALRFDDLLLA